MATRLLTGYAAVAALLCASAAAQIPDQYPKPLVHTATDHPAARVLLLSVDGLHALDLANWVTAHPGSTLAALSRRGVTYTNAHTTAAYPVAGLISLATGGTPISTGIVSDDGFDRALWSAGGNCKSPGAVIALNGAMDDANGSGLDSAHLPLLKREHDCMPVGPHSLVRVNTMFEVVHAKIGSTAWAGEDATATDILRGPSGQGLDQACDGTSAANDGARVQAVLHWIDGKDCIGHHSAAAPALFGMSFTAVAAAQATMGMGYLDATGKPSPALLTALSATDEAIGRMVAELKRQQLYDSTWIVVASPYGQSPMDQRSLQRISLAKLMEVAEGTTPGGVAHISGGDVGMIWLRNAARSDAVVKTLQDNLAILGIQEIYSGTRLTLTLNAPEKDSRMPDIILQPMPGLLWGAANDKTIAGHGGLQDEDTHVALLVSGVQLTGRSDPTWVPTTQLAPLLLRALGLEKFDLQALHMEHTPALPGIF